MVFKMLSTWSIVSCLAHITDKHRVSKPLPGEKIFIGDKQQTNISTHFCVKFWEWYDDIVMRISRQGLAVLPYNLISDYFHGLPVLIPVVWAQNTLDTGRHEFYLPS